MKMSESIDDFLEKWTDFRYCFKISEEDGERFIHCFLANNSYKESFKIFLEGRPDNGQGFLFEYYNKQFKEYVINNSKNEGFILEDDVVKELFEENKKLFEKIFILSHIKKGSMALDDIERWLDSSDFINEHVAHYEDRTRLERHIPLILYIKGLAKIEIAAGKNNYELALTGIHDTIEELEDSEGITRLFDSLKESSLKCLRYLENMIITKKPKTRLDRLHEKLDGYVAEENYEDAIRIRDIIDGLEVD